MTIMTMNTLFQKKLYQFFVVEKHQKQNIENGKFDSKSNTKNQKTQIDTHTH